MLSQIGVSKSKNPPDLKTEDFVSVSVTKRNRQCKLRRGILKIGYSRTITNYQDRLRKVP